MSSSRSLTPVPYCLADMAVIIEFSDLRWWYRDLLEHPAISSVGGLSWFTMASMIVKNRFDPNVPIDKLFTDAEEVADKLSEVSGFKVGSHAVERIYSLMSAMHYRIKSCIPTDSNRGWVANSARGESAVVFLRMTNNDLQSS